MCQWNGKKEIEELENTENNRKNEPELVERPYKMENEEEKLESSKNKLE